MTHGAPLPPQTRLYFPPLLLLDVTCVVAGLVEACSSQTFPDTPSPVALPTLLLLVNGWGGFGETGTFLVEWPK